MTAESPESPENASPAMSKSQYARRRGVGPSMVTRWSQQDRLVLTADGQVDVAATDALLARVLDPSRGGKNGKSTRAPVKRRRGRPPGKRDAKGLPHFDREKARRETYNAETARTRYLKEIGELVSRASTHSAIIGICQTVRQVFEDIPHRYAPQGADKLNVNHRVLIAWLEGVIFEALHAVADDLVGLARAYEGSRWVDEKTRQEVDRWVVDSAKLLRDWQQQNDPVPRSNGDARDGGASGEFARDASARVASGNDTARG